MEHVVVLCDQIVERPGVPEDRGRLVRAHQVVLENSFLDFGNEPREAQRYALYPLTVNLLAEDALR